MPMKSLKSRFANFLVTLIEWASKNKEEEKKGKKQLDQEIFQGDPDGFVVAGREDTEKFDHAKFQSDFLQCLMGKNPDYEDIRMQQFSENSEAKEEGPVEVKKLPENIQKISEDLNDCLNGMEIFTRAFNITAGTVCYTIEKIAPTDKKPFVTYRPSARVITQVHETGVNGGTVFLTCAHKFVKSVDFKGKESGKVVSEEEAIFTPLSKEHALYVCKILNAQSKIFYMQHMKKYQKTK